MMNEAVFGMIATAHRRIVHNLYDMGLLSTHSLDIAR